MDGYSRMIAWLKVLLPLVALALLSTLFLLSRKIDPMAAIPFADAELQEMVEAQKITQPIYSGVTPRGDEITFVADTINPAEANGSSTAENISGQIDRASGQKVVFIADAGEINESADQSIMSGSVFITTSSGYSINSERLIAFMKAAKLVSPGEVLAKGPLGTLTAGAMRLETPAGELDDQLIFTNGVKLVYDPKAKREE